MVLCMVPTLESLGETCGQTTSVYVVLCMVPTLESRNPESQILGTISGSPVSSGVPKQGTPT